jgi:hypothetical protein
MKTVQECESPHLEIGHDLCTLQYQYPTLCYSISRRTASCNAARAGQGILPQGQRDKLVWRAAYWITYLTCI